jgi:hypothetical protein
MYDFNDITYTQDQITEQIQQKDQYAKIEMKIYIYIFRKWKNSVIIGYHNKYYLYYLVYQTENNQRCQYKTSNIFSSHGR